MQSVSPVKAQSTGAISGERGQANWDLSTPFPLLSPLVSPAYTVKGVVLISIKMKYLLIL